MSPQPLGTDADGHVVWPGGPAISGIRNGLGVPVIGTHMEPLRLFGAVTRGAAKARDLEDYLLNHRLVEIEPDGTREHEVLTTFDVYGEPVYLTRAGGLFAEPWWDWDSPSFSHSAWLSDVAARFDAVMCEFAFEGVVSAAAAPVEMGSGRLYQDHAIVVSASVARESYMGRTLNPTAVDPWSLDWHETDEKVVESVQGLSRSSKLASHSRDWPSFVVSAYSTYSRHMVAEATVMAFTVVEQLLNVKWEDHVRTTEGKRHTRLKDPRTYSAAVRAEVLLSAGLLHPGLYESFNLARELRNKVVHVAHASIDSATAATTAMHGLLEDYLGTTIARPETARSSA